MTDHLTENARLRAALEAAKRDTALALAQVDRLLTLTTTLATERDDSREYAVALEAELKARAALATPAPDAVQEAARVLLDDEGRALPRLVQIAEEQWDAGSSMSRCIGAALRAIAERGQP